jgi:glycosyltransferase involved in cell wall biosynthesis
MPLSSDDYGANMLKVGRTTATSCLGSSTFSCGFGNSIPPCHDVPGRPSPVRVALVMAVIADLRGSGGSERLFSALHAHLLDQPKGVECVLVTSTTAASRLQAAEHLASRRNCMLMELGENPGRGVVGVLRLTWSLLRATLRGRFDVVHICLPSPIYVPYLAVLSRLPRCWRPRLASTIVDCTLARSLKNPPPPNTYERQVLDAHTAYAAWTRLDGIYSWYRDFVADFGRDRPVGARVVRAARFCFTDPHRFRPAPVKENRVVFAGRLSEQKRPLLFVDAVAVLRDRAPGLIADWTFAIYGTGVLQEQVIQRIKRHRLESIVTLAHAVDMAPVFATSRVFVSTQALENFTSLAMLEAMAAGNAVIAEDVGQTREFIQDRENGILVSPATSEAFAAAMAAYFGQPELHDRMAASSRRLVTDIHTIEHFADDITSFWRSLLPSAG